METQTQTLAEFLLARIAEDEELARRLGGLGRWYIDHHDRVSEPQREPGTNEYRVDAYGDDIMPSSVVSWTRLDPARVLAECAAKRRIVAESEALADEYAGIGLHAAEQILAQPYADHDDFREEWVL